MTGLFAWFMDSCQSMTRRGPARRTIPEDTLIRLMTRSELTACVEDEGDLDAALGYRADLASAEIGRALIETGRSLSYLHVLVEALEMRGARRGYQEGALVVGRLCNALADDETVAHEAVGHHSNWPKRRSARSP